jgi:hypothetical protein
MTQDNFNIKNVIGYLHKKLDQSGGSEAKIIDKCISYLNSQFFKQEPLAPSLWSLSYSIIEKTCDVAIKNIREDKEDYNYITEGLEIIDKYNDQAIIRIYNEKKITVNHKDMYILGFKDGCDSAISTIEMVKTGNIDIK